MWTLIQKEWNWDSSPLSGPAQAAATSQGTKAGRGEMSSVRHGAVWKNPGEAAQRAGQWMVTENKKGNESCWQANKRYPKRRRKSETICERCCQEGSEGCLCGSGQGDDHVKEGCEQALSIQRTHELSAHGDEEPAGGFASGWFPAEEHRSDEGHAESCEDPGNPGHHAGSSPKRWWRLGS